MTILYAFGLCGLVGVAFLCAMLVVMKRDEERDDE